MKEKNKIYTLAILAASLSVIGGAMAIMKFTECSYLKDGVTFSDGNCYAFLEQKIEPFFWSFLPLLLITLILFFVRRETFLAWAKFAGVAFPLMLAAMLYTFTYGTVYRSLGPGGLFSSDAEAVSVLLPPLFFLISVTIIAIKSWMLRGRKK